MRIYPYGWNFFHLVCVFCPDRDLVKLCIDLDIPFSIDESGETPLHYLFETKNFDFALVNLILENLGNLVSGSIHPHNLVISLSEELPFILALDTPHVANLLNLALGRPISYKGQEIPRFGAVKGGKDFRFLQFNSQIFKPTIQEELIDEKGNNMLSVSGLRFYLNYDPLSDDMNDIVKTLHKVESEAIFENKAIMLLVEYLWKSSRKFHLVMTLIFSSMMFLLTFYSIVRAPNTMVEVGLLWSGIFLGIYEAFQVYFSGSSVYFTDFWNILDIITIISFIGVTLTAWLNASPIVKSWVISIAIIAGYLRWISFFRILDSTRKLIRVIIEIITEVKSFLLVLAFIVIGSSLIFHQFREPGPYSERLILAYFIVFSDFDGFREMSVPETIFFLITSFLLAILLLNLLIAIMTDSYEKVLASSILNDSKEKVTMILETIALLRVFSHICNVNVLQESASEKYLTLRDEGLKTGKGFLFHVTKRVDLRENKNMVTQEWEGRVNSIKTFVHSELKKNFDPLNGHVLAIKNQYDEIRKMNEKIKTLQLDMKSIMDILTGQGFAKEMEQSHKRPSFRRGASSLTRLITEEESMEDSLAKSKTK